MGYILDGVYHKGAAPIKEMTLKEQKTYKDWSHDDQRYEHRRDILQPYNKDGTVNTEFIEQYPDESKEYGFIREEE